MLQGSRAPIVAGVAAVAVALLMIFFLVLPKQAEVSTAEAELAAAQAQQSTLESQLAALEGLELAAPENKAIIQDVERQIPPTADQPGLLLLVKNAAVRSGIALTNLTPSTPILDATTGLSTISLAVTAEGSYFQLTEFLYSIETLPRAAKVLTVQMAPGGGEADTTTTTTITNLLQMQASVLLFTSDQSAGPGSVPGPTEDAAGGA